MKAPPLKGRPAPLLSFIAIAFSSLLSPFRAPGTMLSLKANGGHANRMSNQLMPEITATELKQRLDQGDDLQIIDVREPNEYQVARLPGSTHIPLGQILNRMSEIDATRETVVHCKMGGRSARAIEELKRAGFTGQLVNLKGGITAWSNEVDPSVPKY